MLVVTLLVTALFILLGVLFASGKGAGLIAGYNTMSAKEKEKIDKKKLCSAMAKLMFLLAACFAVASCGPLLHVMALYWVGMVLFLVAVIGGVIWMNTGDRIKK